MCCVSYPCRKDYYHVKNKPKTDVNLVEKKLTVVVNGGK